MKHSVAFLLDADNTLLDNDRILADFMGHIEQTVGHQGKQRYWAVFEELRDELGYHDYLGALQGYRNRFPHEPRLMSIGSFMLNYPFADRLYSRSLEVVRHLQQWGVVAILTDGDMVFQPRKMEQSGLAEAAGGNVLIYVHKEEELEDVERRYPADHYVLVDDKLRILTAAKKAWGRRVTTVFPRQGHYALDPEILAQYPPADLSLEGVGDLLTCELPALIQAGQSS